MTELYPISEPYKTSLLDIGDGHSLFIRCFGNPTGQPVVYLHGGPGAGTTWEYRLFSPEHYNIILFDQRGSGESKPYASIRNNTIDTLVADVERVRVAAGVDEWMVTGGSWGTALGMFYATLHKDRVSRMLLRGVFFGDQTVPRQMIEGSGPTAKNRNGFFSEYENHIPEIEREDGLLLPYHRRLTSSLEIEAIEAARLFHRWNISLATFERKAALTDGINRDPLKSLAISRIFFHFVVNEFQDGNRDKLLQSMSGLDIPIAIIHGKDDKICPVESAEALHAVCKNSTLHVAENCGHSMSEPGLQRAFLEITDKWALQRPVGLGLAGKPAPAV